MKKKITIDEIMEVSFTIINEGGIHELSIKKVAGDLGIKPPSLYNHIKNLEDLMDRMCCHSLKELSAVLSDAVVGKEKYKALYAIAHALRNFSKSQPGKYGLTQSPYLWVSEETRSYSENILNLLRRILTDIDMTEEDKINFIRAFRSYLHGFIHLELNNSFQLPQDKDASFDYGLNIVLNGM